MLANVEHCVTDANRLFVSKPWYSQRMISPMRFRPGAAADKEHCQGSASL